jgi:signal transduction histidine kinase
MQTAEDFLSARVVTVYPEQRLGEVADLIAAQCADFCAVLNPTNAALLGYVRLCEVAARPNGATRIFLDLMQPPPPSAVESNTAALQIAQLFRSENPRVIVVTNSGRFAGFITHESFARWFLDQERERKEELERLLDEQKRLLRFVEDKSTEKLDVIKAAIRRIDLRSLALSHDIRSPLSAIREYASMLSNGDGGVLNDGGIRAAGRIETLATKAEELAQALLSDAKTVVSDEPRNGGVVDLNAALADATQFLETEIRKRRAVIRCAAPLPTVQGSYASVLQIFVNLIGNALKHTPPEKAPLIDVNAEVENQQVSLAIRDNGNGIPAENLTKIFQPFVSFAPAELGGIGIGLFITMHAVRDLHGSITVHSEQGGGSCFLLNLQRGAA